MATEPTTTREAGERFVAAFADDTIVPESAAVQAALNDMAFDGITAFEAAVRHDTTIAAIQRACGLESPGHTWTHWEAGDGVWFQSGRDFCETCGMARDYEGEEG